MVSRINARRDEFINIINIEYDKMIEQLIEYKNECISTSNKANYSELFKEDAKNLKNFNEIQKLNLDHVKNEIKLIEERIEFLKNGLLLFKKCNFECLDELNQFDLGEMCGKLIIERMVCVFYINFYFFLLLIFII
jgi:hypothetical protein